MGNKKNRKAGVRSKVTELPFVSVCTPTFNRRPFIPSMIKCFLNQTYPMSKMEWIIIDDGTDKVMDLFADVPNVKYFSYDENMVLGKKRNLMHEKSSGEIIVYMDDDDYYPPERVSHSVEKLLSNKQFMCAGSSELHIYFEHLKKIVQFGPYGAKHATAGTFAFKRALLKDHAYDDEQALAEEKAFLKNYTVPFVQLDTRKTILVFAHNHNTFDKKKLLINPNSQYVKDSPYVVDDFICEDDQKHFYTETLSTVLDDYEPGRPEMKPDVIEQTKKITEARNQAAKDYNERMRNEIHDTMALLNPEAAKSDKAGRMIPLLQNKVKQMAQQINGLSQENAKLRAELNRLNKLSITGHALEADI